MNFELLQLSRTDEHACTPGGLNLTLLLLQLISFVGPTAHGVFLIVRLPFIFGRFLFSIRFDKTLSRASTHFATQPASVIRCCFAF